MDTDSGMKEVRFHGYCSRCKYGELNETKDPCNECLCEPFRLHSSKPLNYKSKDDKSKDKID